jgi:hypothetical protein
MALVIPLGCSRPLDKGFASPEKERPKEAVEEWPTLFYHDFRRAPDSLRGPVLGVRMAGLAGSVFGQGPLLSASQIVDEGMKQEPLPPELFLVNVRVKEHVQFQPEGLLIQVPKTYAINPRGGLGVQTKFAIKGDFDIIASFTEFQGESPPSGGGVHLGIYLTGKGGAHAQLSRAVRPGNNQGILWKFFGRPYDEGMSPAAETTGRLRLKRTETVLAFLWAPGLQGGNFKTIHQCEFGDHDIANHLLNVNTSGAACDLTVRLLDWRVRRAPEGKAPVASDGGAQVPADNRPSGLAVPLLITLTVALLLALGASFLAFKRRRQRVSISSVSAPSQAGGPSPQTLVFPCPNCNANLKANAELRGAKVKCPQCGTRVSS